MQFAIPSVTINSIHLVGNAGKRVFMAGRILNRRTLREQAEHADRKGAAADEEQAKEKPAKTSKAAKSAKAKAPAAPKKRKPRAKKEPPRFRARWGIFNNSGKQVEIYDYRDRNAADKKLAVLLAKDKGLFYLQLIKEPMPVPDPALQPPA